MKLIQEWQGGCNLQMQYGSICMSGAKMCFILSKIVSRKHNEANRFIWDSAIILDVDRSEQVCAGGYGWALQCGCSPSKMPMKLQPQLPDFLYSNPNV